MPKKDPHNITPKQKKPNRDKMCFPCMGGAHKQCTKKMHECECGICRP